MNQIDKVYIIDTTDTTDTINTKNTTNTIDNGNRNKSYTSIDKLKQFIYHNEYVVKTAFVIVTLLFIYWVLWCECSKYKNKTQSGGASAAIGVYGSAINRVKGGVSNLGKISLLSGGFTYLFQFVNVIFMLIGIVVILILIPSLPIIFFVIISYFIAREKLWQLRTL